MGRGRGLNRLDRFGTPSRQQQPSLRTITVAFVTALILAALFAMPSIASAYMTTLGGPVQAEPHVYEIYWGSNWNAEPGAAERGRLETFYNDLSGSAWQGILTQYWSPNGFVSSNVPTASYTDTVHGGPPANVTKAMMETEINEAIAANSANGWPQSPTVNDQFVLLMAPGSTYSPPNPSYCGFHESTNASIVYGFVDWGGTRCSMTVTAAHEYAEAVTDPYPGYSFPAKGAWRDWYSSSNNEIADVCGAAGRGFLPGGIEVPSLFDDSINKPSGGCSVGHSNPPQVAPEIITEAASNVTGSQATLHGAVHPNGLQVEFWWYKYGTGCLCESTSANSWGQGQKNYSPVGRTIPENGLQLNPGTTYKFQLVTETGEPGKGGTGTRQFGPVREFTTVGIPVVTTALPPRQHAGVATVGGTVNPNGVAAEYWVEFTTGADFEKNGWTNASKQPVPAAKLSAGSSPVEVSQQLSGLAPTTQYAYRLAAKNEAGTGYGNLHYFSTWQTTAITGAASQIGTADMNLRATINPEGLATKYRFEYGTSTSYGQSVPVSAESIGSGIEDVEVAQSIAGLKANTTYHYRVVAENSAGSVIKGSDVAATTTGGCKGTEAKCEWKAQSAPDLTGAEYHLDGVSCASVSICFGVGRDQLKSKGLIERWNGSEWTVQFKLNGSGGYPVDVACPSSALCLVAGSIEGGGPKAWKFKEEAGGWSQISETPPTPSGGSKAILQSISCSSTTACTAVGTYYSESTYKLLVERWNGTSWSLQTAPNPSEASSFGELGVSCPSASSCLIAGNYLKGTTTLSFAESWNGTSWSALSAQNPGFASRLKDISCTSSSACSAVGVYQEAKGQAEKPLAESWNGSAWSVQTTPSPAEATGSVALKGISCTSSSACTAVGFYVETTKQRTLAEAWDGTKWTVQSTTNPNAATNALNQVSCSAAGTCTAVGSGRPEQLTTEGETSIAERLSAGEWKTQTTSNLATSESRLEEVSCASSSMCFAVGRDELRGKVPVERWNGSTWTLQSNLKGGSGAPANADVSCPTTTWCMLAGSLGGGGAKTWLFKEAAGAWSWSSETPPTPSGGSKAILRSISCPSASACTAVGYYYLESEKTYKPLVERWNGTAWSLQSAPNGPGGEGASAMLSVSCPTSTSCTTVGKAGSATFAERWSATEGWTATTPLNPGSLENTLEDVSCSTITNCIAVGTFKETGKGQFTKPLTERWNGSEWSLLTTPGPSEAQNVNLSSVSCASSSCTAVGQYVTDWTSGEEKTLAEYWDGAKWVIQASVNSAQKVNALSGVSCSSSIVCTAVGLTQPEAAGFNEGQAALVARYE